MKRYVLVAAAAAFLLLALTAFVVGSSPAAPNATIEVGSARGGVNAVEFVGRVDQGGPAGTVFTSTGYLTRISGLTQTLLFSGTLANATEATAHFTFFTKATLTSHFVITGAGNSLTSSVFVIDSVGTTVYYYNPTPSGNFKNPSSFAAGTPIMTATVRSQNILNVQAPNFGVGTNFAEFVQTGVHPFTLNGQAYQLGSIGLMERVFSTGQGIRTNSNPATTQSFTVLAGNAVVTGVPGQPDFLPLVLRNSP